MLHLKNIIIQTKHNITFANFAKKSITKGLLFRGKVRCFNSPLRLFSIFSVKYTLGNSIYPAIQNHFKQS